MVLYITAGVLWLIGIPFMTRVFVRSYRDIYSPRTINVLGIFWPATILLGTLLAIAALIILAFISLIEWVSQKFHRIAWGS